MTTIYYAQRLSNDREDFIEDKIQIDNLIRLNLPFKVLKRDQSYNNKFIVGHGFGSRERKGNPIWPDFSQVPIVNNYHKTKTFAQYAQRDFKICTYEEDTIARVAKELGGKVLIKYAGAQKVTPIFEIDTSKDIHKQIMDECGWEMVRVGGEDRQAIVQRKIDMFYEYRVFVVNGRPITGAGCIDHFTPLENASIFDRQVQVLRDSGEKVVIRSAVADQYEESARIICEQFKKEGLLHYVLDLFIDEKSEVGIVELNPIHMSGFYAIDYPSYFEAVYIQATKENLERAVK